MSVFNSLGSNYTFLSAMRILFSFGSKKECVNLEAYLEKRYGGKAILTYKGREALALALSALPKDTVAINGFTCLAVYEAIIEGGHEVHYLDIAQDDLNFSVKTLRGAVDSNPAIKVVVIQNTLGYPCDIRAIATLCRERNLILIEDLAHSIGARYASGEEAGTVGDFTILSFSQDKVVDSVSGGALIIRNPSLCKSDLHKVKNVPLTQQLKDRFYPILTWKVRVLHPFGIGKILHKIYRALHLLSTPFGNDNGKIHALSGWYCSNILSGFKKLDRVAQHRKIIADFYASNLDPQLLLPETASIPLRFPIFVQNRAAVIEHLRAHQIFVSDIWYDAPIAPKKYIHKTNYRGQCPGAEKVSETILNLPTHINVTERDARAIVKIVRATVKIDEAYQIREIKEEQQWEDFLSTQKPHSFLPSWKWGQHYELSGSKVFRLGLYKSDELKAIALFIKIAARRGSFLLCPHGPVIAENEKLTLELITRRATEIARQEHCAFIRICPLATPSADNIAIYRSMGFRGAPIHMHPELSWILDITKSEEDLLREMRKTTRYLIKKMEKEGVEITKSKNPDDIEKFWFIYQATVERRQFTPFSKEYLRTEFELFAKDDLAAFFFGTYKGELIAAAIIIFYNGQAFYHHSGSIQKFNDVNASYLLQWRVIQEARRRGCTLYNFWGISPTDRPKHPWAGLSLFKKGFGGFAEEYLHAQDKPLTAKYALNYIVESARKIKRGL